MERGIAISNSNELCLEHLPAELAYKQEQAQAPNAVATPLSEPEPSGLQNYAEWERKRIWELMQKYKANKSKIASELGIARGTLYKKLREYGL